MKKKENMIPEKNKKCQRPLPEGYKYIYCESCRNDHAKVAKNIGKGALLVGGFAITILTAGKINANDKA